VEPAVVDDPWLDRAVATARAQFLSGKPFDRLDVALLVRQPDGTWRRGSFGPDALAYPASCVKLPFLVAAVHCCRLNGHPCDFLDDCVGPMVRNSDNVQTGVVVDTITGTTNLPDLTDPADPRLAPWLAARRYAERLLAEHGLLAGQTLLHKTYPTNSGEMPVGAEKVARTVCGMNRMSPRAASSLMLQIVCGAIEPAARGYMLGLLDHDPRGGASVLGFGLPPGTRYHNKPGQAYDTLEDIAYAVLPSGHELIVAAFSNAFCKPYSEYPPPHHCSQLGPFMETLLQTTGLAGGKPPVATAAAAPASGRPAPGKR